MDLSKEIEVILRDNHYETRALTDLNIPVVYFENESIMGFAHVFNNGSELIEEWQKAQDVTLARFKPELRKAGEKAWNVYSIFLTEQNVNVDSKSNLNKIEENFQLTRKIARAGIISREQLFGALIPLLSIRNRPVLDKSNFEERLRVYLSELNSDAATAFLKDINPSDIVQILSE